MLPERNLNNGKEVRQLLDTNLDEILELENKSWVVGLRVTREQLEERLKLGHYIFGLYEKNKLIGKICFVLSGFDPDSINFPTTFSEFSNPKRLSGNALFVYNLDILPQNRNGFNAKKLINQMLAKAKELNVEYVVADGRMPSYNGNTQVEEKIEQNHLFKKAVDAYFENGIPLREEDWTSDPVLGFYHLLTGAKLWKVLKGFINEDIASGGMRSILYLKL